jgi:hypothetical protein
MIRAWCDENLRGLVLVQWHFEDGFCTPVAHFANPVDAVELALRWA